jgi:hypothetical protein
MSLASVVCSTVTSAADSVGAQSMTTPRPTDDGGEWWWPDEEKHSAPSSGGVRSAATSDPESALVVSDAALLCAADLARALSELGHSGRPLKALVLAELDRSPLQPPAAQRGLILQLARTRAVWRMRPPLERHAVQLALESVWLHPPTVTVGEVRQLLGDDPCDPCPPTGEADCADGQQAAADWGRAHRVLAAVVSLSRALGQLELLTEAQQRLAVLRATGRIATPRPEESVDTCATALTTGVLTLRALATDDQKRVRLVLVASAPFHDWTLDVLCAPPERSSVTAQVMSAVPRGLSTVAVPPPTIGVVKAAVVVVVAAPTVPATPAASGGGPMERPSVVDDAIGQTTTSQSVIECVVAFAQALRRPPCNLECNWKRAVTVFGELPMDDRETVRTLLLAEPLPSHISASLGLTPHDHRQPPVAETAASVEVVRHLLQAAATIFTALQPAAQVSVWRLVTGLATGRAAAVDSTAVSVCIDTFELGLPRFRRLAPSQRKAVTDAMVATHPAAAGVLLAMLLTPGCSWQTTVAAWGGGRAE